jgi:hypothetical protein
MDSRLSAPYNVRAAKLAMIPGGAGGIHMNAYEGGEPAWETLPAKKMIPEPDTNFCGVPQLSSIGELREHDVAKYSRMAFAKDSTYTHVLGDNDIMNQQFTKVPKSYLTVVNFDIIGSEKYPEAPVLWETWIGANARQFGRSDGIKYRR